MNGPPNLQPRVINKSQWREFSSIFNKDALLPNMVFNSAANIYTVFLFDEMLTSNGAEVLKRFADKFGDQKIKVFSLDPRSYDINSHKYDWFFEFDVSTISSEYFRAIDWRPLEPRYPDSMHLISNVICWWGDSCRWGIFGQREFEICISNQFELTQERNTTIPYWRGSIYDVEKIIEPIGISKVKSHLFMKELIARYGCR